MAMTSDQLQYLMAQAEKTFDACRKKYDFRNGLVIENEWAVALDRGRYVIRDKSRNLNLDYSSLDSEDVQAAIDAMVRTYNK